MDQLVEIVAQKTGVQHEQAEIAVVAAREYLRGSLSGAARAEIDALIRRQASATTVSTSSLIRLYRALQRFA